MAHDGHGNAEAAGHGHDHGPAGEKRTHFTDKTELFVEFPRLVVGEKSAFAAHLTTLSNFRALEAGKVTVLSGGNLGSSASTARAGLEYSGRRATPKQAGQRELIIEVTTKDFSVRHALGQVTVFPDRKTSDASAGEEDGGIGFTKEQQWKVDFATAEVVKRPLRTAITASGTLGARPDGEALVSCRTNQARRHVQFSAKRSRRAMCWPIWPRVWAGTPILFLGADAKQAKVEPGDTGNHPNGKPLQG